MTHEGMVKFGRLHYTPIIGSVKIWVGGREIACSVDDNSRTIWVAKESITHMPAITRRARKRMQRK